MNNWRRRLAESRRRRQVKAYQRSNVGENTRISRRVQIYGWHNVRIGTNTIISDDTLINAVNLPRDESTVTIGSHCFLGRRNFLTAGGSLIIGDYTLTGPDCHLLGAYHSYRSPYLPYSVAACVGGEIALGVNCWLGARVTILENVRIGHGSIVGACSVVTHDIPPFSIAIGNPARVVQRFDAKRDCWVKIADFPEDGERICHRRGSI